MEIKSERLTFREFQESDFQLFYSVFSNEQIMRYALMDRFSCEEAARPYFSSILSNNTTAENRAAYEYAVFLSSSNTFIGVADIMIRYENNMAWCGEIGYFLLPAFWGSGFATEIAKTLAAFGFEKLQLPKVVASCNANNASSEGVMKKIGMIKEGEFRKARFKNGHWYNELRYGILSEEWEK